MVTPARSRSRRAIPRSDLFSIREINIKGLFGTYDFPPIRLRKGADSSAKLAFLYGENGVGKTTILRLLYALLSPEPSAGHRSFLAATRFRQFSVTFDDGQVVSAVRTNKSTAGPYDYVLEGPRAEFRLPVDVSDNQRVLGTSNPQMGKLETYLEQLSPIIIFVNDQRTIRSTYEPWDIHRSLKNHRTHAASLEEYYFLRENDSLDEVDIEDLVRAGLVQLLRSTNRRFVEHAMSGTARGNLGTGQVYLNVAKTISKSGANPERSTDELEVDVRRSAKVVKDFSKAFGEFSLVQDEYLEEIEHQLELAKSNNKQQLLEVIEPYFSSLEKRIQETLPLSQQMAAFERGVNSFLTRKHMVSRLDGPIKFIGDDGHELAAMALSSGERHLIYLCCASVLSHDHPTLMIIDEPELSLNYRWQQRLVDALALIAAPTAQFVMATHSFEIIAKHRGAAIELEPT